MPDHCYSWPIIKGLFFWARPSHFQYRKEKRQPTRSLLRWGNLAPLFDGDWFSFSQLKYVMGLLNLLGVLSDPRIFAKTWEGAGPWHSIQQWNYFSFPGRINALVCKKCQIKRLSQNGCILKILCELVQAIQRAAELCKPVQLSAARPPWQSRQSWQSWKSWKYRQYRQSWKSSTILIILTIFTTLVIMTILTI